MLTSNSPFVYRCNKQTTRQEAELNHFRLKLKFKRILVQRKILLKKIALLLQASQTSLLFLNQVQTPPYWKKSNYALKKSIRKTMKMLPLLPITKLLSRSTLVSGERHFDVHNCTHFEVTIVMFEIAGATDNEASIIPTPSPKIEEITSEPSLADQNRRISRQKFNEQHSCFDHLCPLSYQPIHDAVIAEDGITYERCNIEEWFEDCIRRQTTVTSPATAQVIGQSLTDDNNFRGKIISNTHELTENGEIPSIQKLRAVFAELDPLREFLSETVQEWQPPQFVVIGQESSGKSTLLERLTMMPIFPRDHSFCTRMPLHVQLRHSEKAKTPRMEVFNVETGITEEGPIIVPMRWAALDVQQKMLEILQKEDNLQGVSTTRIIVLSIEGPHMPSIDLVDMPGLVSSPPSLKEQTRLLVQQHIQRHEKYSMFLVTVPGDTSPNISIAMDVIQEMGLHEKTLGVFTMCDDIQPRKLEIFRERLQLHSIELGSTLIHRGWVATMNAPNDAEPGLLAKIALQAKQEDGFFKAHMPDLHPNTVSCRALIMRMNEMYTNHLKVTWAPATINLIENACELAQEQNSKLGLPEYHICRDDAVELAVIEAKKILETSLPDVVQNCCRVILKPLKNDLKVLISKSNVFEKPELVCAWIADQESKIIEVCEKSILDLERLFVFELGNILQASHTGPFQLTRFPLFIEAIIAQGKLILNDVSATLRISVVSCIKSFFGEMSPWMSLKIDLDKKDTAVTLSCETDFLVDNVMFAFVRGLPYQKLIDGVAGASLHVDSWIESCANNRLQILDRLQRLRAAEKSIANLLDVDLDKMLEERKEVNDLNAMALCYDAH